MFRYAQHDNTLIYHFVTKKQSFLNDCFYTNRRSDVCSASSVLISFPLPSCIKQERSLILCLKFNYPPPLEKVKQVVKSFVKAPILKDGAACKKAIVTQINKRQPVGSIFLFQDPSYRKDVGRCYRGQINAITPVIGQARTGVEVWNALSKPKK